jgi:RNase P subunit RPR2
MIILDQTLRFGRPYEFKRHFCEHCQGRTSAWEEEIEHDDLSKEKVITCLLCGKVTSQKIVINNNHKYDRAKILRYDSKRPSFTR